MPVYQCKPRLEDPWDKGEDCDNLLDTAKDFWILKKKAFSQPTVYVDVVFRFVISIMFPSGFDSGHCNDPVHLQGIQHWPVK